MTARKPRKPRTRSIKNKAYRVNAVFNSDGRLFYAEPSDYFAQWAVGKRVAKAILTLVPPRKKGGRA